MISVPIISAALSALSAGLLLWVPTRHPSEGTPTVPPSTKCNFLCWILKTFPTMSPFSSNPILCFYSAPCTFSVCSVSKDPGVFLVAQTVKKLPAMQETQVWSLGWEDPLEKGMATHSRILAWKTPWTEESGGPQSTVLQRVGHDWAIKYYPHGAILQWWFPTLNAHQISLGSFSKERYMTEPHSELNSLSAIAWAQTLVSSKAPLHFPWPW